MNVRVCVFIIATQKNNLYFHQIKYLQMTQTTAMYTRSIIRAFFFMNILFQSTVLGVNKNSSMNIFLAATIIKAVNFIVVVISSSREKQ